MSPELGPNSDAGCDKEERESAHSTRQRLDWMVSNLASIVHPVIGAADLARNSLDRQVGVVDLLYTLTCMHSLVLLYAPLSLTSLADFA